uniref:Uncharacterized protein n=1 Tax=viral metagenome TaxID=1070528 RepID=A0A6M3LRS6_9ZZZZ
MKTKISLNDFITSLEYVINDGIYYKDDIDFVYPTCIHRDGDVLKITLSDEGRMNVTVSV